MKGQIPTPPESKEAPERNPKRHFIFKGFSQVKEFRIFAFESIAEDWTRGQFTVQTNLTLTRRYGIRLQDLPLLCRAILEQSLDSAEQRAFTFTEEDMRIHAVAVASRAAVAKHQNRWAPPR